MVYGKTDKQDKKIEDNAPASSKKDIMFRRAANKTPIAISGLMLGLFSTGNMVPEFRWFFGFFAIVILIILVNKIVLDWHGIKDELRDPGTVGVASTFPMAIVVLSTYILPYYYNIALTMWIVSMGIHLLMMVYFFALAIIKFDLKNCVPSYFIVYVGFSLNAFIAPLYGQLFLGKVLFWFGFVSFLALLLPLLYRVMVIKNLSEPLIPSLVIFASPASVVLNGYINVYRGSENNLMIWLLFAFSFMLFVGSLNQVPKILKLRFYPSYASLTFPFVITGIAMNGTYSYLSNNGNDIVLIRYIAQITVSLALVFVLYALVKYIYNYLIHPLKTV